MIEHDRIQDHFENIKNPLPRLDEHIRKCWRPNLIDTNIYHTLIIITSQSERDPPAEDMLLLREATLLLLLLLLPCRRSLLPIK